MALSPLQPREERVVQIAAPPSPSRTYALDFDGDELLRPVMIDGDEALRQAIRKTIATARYRYLIYDGQYGCELERLLGEVLSPELLNLEIKRAVREALLADERIQDVGGFDIRREGDMLFIAFTVKSGHLTLKEEVAIGNV
ncbi:DUF2634 domain-containing protein [Paenibacillus kobensis]|uniref:DUF2634 domain-containing protein n=1 Tax=Paenibacillus kobensis TaxID=59841 RepID=UPI000FDB92AD|nr:DUF2634 domain-containing protein [Paenibacillus kobensis]